MNGHDDGNMDVQGMVWNGMEDMVLPVCLVGWVVTRVTQKLLNGFPPNVLEVCILLRALLF